MDIVTIVLCSVLALILIQLWQDISKKLEHRRKIAEAIDVLPGEKWYPLIGTTYSFLKAGRKNFWKAFTYRNKTYGPIFRTWMGFIPSVHVMKPQHVEVILNNSQNITKGPNYRFIVPWLGQGLLTSSGHHWQTHRKLITPTFHFSILDAFQEVFYEKSEKLVEILSQKADGQYFDVMPYLARCALDVICETAMGTTVNALGDANSEYVRAVYDMSELAVSRMYKAILHNDIIFRMSEMGKQQKKLLTTLHGFTRKVIKERREKLRSKNETKRQLTEEEILMGKKERKAFLDLLLEGSNNWTDEEIREEVDTFMFAGHDTTTISTCWTLFALANHPDIQDKVHQELDQIFQGTNRPIVADDLIEMKYLDRVLKEVLRLHNIVPAIARTLDKDIVFDGHKIPAGVMVVVHLYELHRDPEQYPEPEKFDPDRFLPENAAKRHPYAYCPFSAGPRNCIGQKFASRNSRTIVANILRKFKVKSLNTPENTECFAEIVMRPQDGLQIALEPRTPNIN
ncbi:cytochrome P450 4C1 [Aethina tumida]|uniref:cytochrome P450 4C1 n=1 Tax=Aethina tumida TaxID=116153 RepID=UPI00096B4719|nr:cytochrome P450 4C1 [Aethina tumida]